MLDNKDIEQITSLIKIIKEREFIFPDPGGRGMMNAKSKTTQHEFVFNITRGRHNPKQCSYLIRTVENDLLFRIDLEGPAHPNPNNEDVPCPHMHIYLHNGTSSPENWAFPLHEKIPVNADDLVEVLQKFLEYNNVEETPTIVTRLYFDN